MDSCTVLHKYALDQCDSIFPSLDPLNHACKHPAFSGQTANSSARSASICHSEKAQGVFQLRHMHQSCMHACMHAHLTRYVSFLNSYGSPKKPAYRSINYGLKLLHDVHVTVSREFSMEFLSPPCVTNLLLHPLCLSATKAY